MTAVKTVSKKTISKPLSGTPWRQIKAMRNIVAHSYGTVDPEITWEIITDDIPTLKKYCETIIAAQE